MAEICGYCGLQALNLPRCSGCKQIHYCSRECQQKDWKGQHKAKCMEVQSHVHKENADLLMTEQQSTMKKSEGHRTEKLAQKDDQLEGDDKKSGTRSHGKCIECGKSVYFTQKCSRCMQMNFCSSKCLRQNWKAHKPYCASVKEEDYKSITTDEVQPHEAFVSGTSRQAGFQQAKKQSRGTFVNSNLIQYIPQIRRNLCGIRETCASTYFVGIISRINEDCTKCINLQDEIGNEVQVMFVLERDGGKFHICWDDVVPGRYLCIKDPFIDYSERLMLVNQASNVRILSVKLDTTGRCN